MGTTDGTDWAQHPGLVAMDRSWDVGQDIASLFIDEETEAQ